jgi:hypothetical protein
MSSEKKKMVNKTFSHCLHASKDASTSMLGEVMITECARATGIGECHPFLRRNAHSGPIPWTGSLRRARRRRGNPQHFVRQHEGIVEKAEKNGGTVEKKRKRLPLDRTRSTPHTE